MPGDDLVAFVLMKFLFLKFVETNEGMLLENAVTELQKVLTAEEADGKEEQYMNCVICSRQYDGHELKLNLVQAICVSISIWCDSTLLDYHLPYLLLNLFNLISP